MTPLTLITGGAGFIGSNLAFALLQRGERVLIYDNLSRPGVERNVEWLQRAFGAECELCIGDIGDERGVRDALARASSVFHLAAQVAVTKSLLVPTHDFEVNARGTLNVLEALRARPDHVPLVYTSTNKVYGALLDVALRVNGDRYEPEDPSIEAHGISEERPLDFHSPYGCSKGAAEQYVRDYARSYGLDTVVLRMSCIYGPRQFGTEDQGWVAHFLIRAMQREPLTLYGDGRQVRDVLFVGDLVNAMLLARARARDLRGMAFNIGGGSSNTASLLEVIDVIEDLHGRRPRHTHQGWRVGDQRYYVSDTRRFESVTGWRPTVGVREGLSRLHLWLTETERRAPPLAVGTAP